MGRLATTSCTLRYLLRRRSTYINSSGQGASSEVSCYSSICVSGLARKARRKGVLAIRCRPIHRRIEGRVTALPPRAYLIHPFLAFLYFSSASDPTGRSIYHFHYLRIIECNCRTSLTRVDSCILPYVRLALILPCLKHYIYLRLVVICNLFL